MENKDLPEEPTNQEDMNQKEPLINPEEHESGALNQENEAIDPTANPLEAEIEKLKAQNEELKDKYLRLFAEFDNYKKRALKEKLDFMKTAAQDTLSALIPVLDDFDRAKKNADAPNSTETFSEGVKLVYQKLYGILAQQGLEFMDTNGEVFDPELHEAFSEIPVQDESMKGKIIDTLEKGYKLKDKIIRHAKVVVGK